MNRKNIAETLYNITSALKSYIKKSSHMCRQYTFNNHRRRRCNHLDFVLFWITCKALYYNLLFFISFSSDYYLTFLFFYTYHKDYITYAIC